MRVKKGIDELRKLFDLTGKVAVVTGGSGGAGKAISIGLALYGADVVVTSRTLSTLEETAAEVRKLGRKALPISCDVVDPESVNNMVKQAMDEFGRIDTVVTCAGIALRHPAEEMPIEEWQKVMDVNVKGTFLSCQAVGKEMIKRGEGGTVITIGSIRGLQGHPAGYSGYGTSKGAVHLMTKQLATEWAKFKIRVNCIAPCIFWTPLTEPILKDPEMYKIFMQRIPLGRAAEPEDLVGAAVYLASEASAMVTGHILYVDGGTSAW
ncbi:MAG: glucose 1-dehydrogenase [Deltaproteobacteria bacterium]|nr:glucose 1-dehydrogenase [Deltaproteobacteria bacterium]MBW1920789.1 glucose 1-dehydrogenase [Deltaproteobacteria bacterium]MBW1935613.1 glucose 1-dehydrogenase [Deltaproteobacteria bacterium]MBW1978006.1 glucose 1-dehydrogenase [Deltaproteobacteria bacterium]MBW2045724.1 glucose 1-dehydrogenase [Deltaproteobacteria bacterium]